MGNSLSNSTVFSVAAPPNSFELDAVDDNGDDVQSISDIAAHSLSRSSSTDSLVTFFGRSFELQTTYLDGDHNPSPSLFTTDSNSEDAESEER